MTDLQTAAAQLALEALEGGGDSWRRIGPAIDALKAALEQPEQEPVAWQWLNTAHFRKKLPADAERGAWNPLFTHPPRREWRGQSEAWKCACGANLYIDADGKPRSKANG
jgi:hypothetical protein